MHSFKKFFKKGKNKKTRGGKDNEKIRFNENQQTT